MGARTSATPTNWTVPTRTFNEFNLDRVYLEVHGRLWERGRLRATLEGGDVRNPGSQTLDVVTKHFFLEVQEPFYRGSWLRVGLTDLPWVPYAEGQWGYRLQGTVFADRSGYLSSTDLGIMAGGTLGRRGSWSAGVVNGETWKHRETGRHKDVHGRLTLLPFGASSGPARHLLIAGFGAAGTYDTATSGPDARRQLIGQAGYLHAERLTVMGEALWTRDPSDRMVGRYPSLAARAGLESRGVGTSIYAVANGSALGISNRWEAIGRWDHLDPDDQIGNNSLDRYIVGASFRSNSHVVTLVNAEVVRYDAGALLTNESRAMVQMQVTFCRRSG